MYWCCRRRSARRRVADTSGPADALGRNVRQIHIVPVPPDDLPAFGIEAQNFFLLVTGAGFVAIDEIDLAPHDDRRANPSGLVVLPEDIFPASRDPNDRSGRFRANAILLRTAPIRPIHGIADNRAGSGFGGGSRLGRHVSARQPASFRRVSLCREFLQRVF